MKLISKSIIIDKDRKITIETGKLAKQADGAVVVRQGKAMLLATVVAEKESDPNINFLPLSVDYQEKFSSGGKIPGGFTRREGKLSDREVLISRFVDRALRPMFPKDYHSQIQISINLISADPDVEPDSLAALAASAAIAVSDIPIIDYISEVRVCKINGELKINPSPKEIKNADIDIIVGATIDHVIMVEGEMNEVSEEEMLEAIIFGHEAIIDHCKIQKELCKEAEKEIKRKYTTSQISEKIKQKIYDNLYKKIFSILEENIPGKKQRHQKLREVKNSCLEILQEDIEKKEISEEIAKHHIDYIEKVACREYILSKNTRLDNRDMSQVREIWSEVNYLPGCHGSAIFTRGETQSLTTVTLGGKLDEQIVDSVMESGYNKFLLHYNFPAFSTGEVRPSRGPGRREIGHGNLAMKALKKILPDDNLYTIRIVSDILESNGSSSMATVCAASLALMDAGVKIKRPVSGIAMGLISDKETDKNLVLSDIMGDEDHIGDMDFKITGTEQGITACQMDIKIEGISRHVIEKALQQSKQGRLHILEQMNKSLSKPREEFKENAPRIEIINVLKEEIGLIIGPGGKTIQEIQKDTGSFITIENFENRGEVKIIAPNKISLEKTKHKINLLTEKPEINKVYKGKIKNILDFGAFVEFLPNKNGLLHISEVMWERVEDIRKIYKEGDEIEVKLIGIDPKTEKYRLSRKALIPKE